MFVEIEKQKTLAELHKQEAVVAEAKSKILEGNMRLAAFAPQAAAAPPPTGGGMSTIVKAVLVIACLGGGAYALRGNGSHGGGAVRAGVMGSSYDADGPRDHQGRLVRGRP